MNSSTWHHIDAVFCKTLLSYTDYSVCRRYPFSDGVSFQLLCNFADTFTLKSLHLRHYLFHKSHRPPFRSCARLKGLPPFGCSFRAYEIPFRYIRTSSLFGLPRLFIRILYGAELQFLTRQRVYRVYYYVAMYRLRVRVSCKPLFKCSAGKARPKNAITYITKPEKAAFVSVRNLLLCTAYCRRDFAVQFFEFDDTVF